MRQGDSPYQPLGGLLSGLRALIEIGLGPFKSASGGLGQESVAGLNPTLEVKDGVVQHFKNLGSLFKIIPHDFNTNFRQSESILKDDAAYLRRRKAANNAG